jgi:hypothetical protein
VPLLGKSTPEKHILEATLMTGTIGLFLTGIYLSVFKINKARKQLDEHVSKLAADRAQLTRISQVLRDTRTVIR